MVDEARALAHSRYIMGQFKDPDELEYRAQIAAQIDGDDETEQLDEDVVEDLDVAYAAYLEEQQRKAVGLT